MISGSDRPDYSRPSVDIERRADAEWLWGVTHTVRSDTIVPSMPNAEYSLTVKVQRLVADVIAGVTFSDLYARAGRIARARCDDIARGDADVHRSITCHTWRTFTSEGRSFAMAMIMIRLTRPSAGERISPGEPAPTKADLISDGGATLVELRRHSPQSATEVLVEFDHRPAAAGVLARFMYSYGERVPTNSVESFEPFVRRAENDARWYGQLFELPGASSASPSIAHREWYMAGRLVTVELHLTR